MRTQLRQQQERLGRHLDQLSADLLPVVWASWATWVAICCWFLTVPVASRQRQHPLGSIELTSTRSPDGSAMFRL
jgi:hypothetical protein